jgi:hypothetical protein
VKHPFELHKVRVARAMIRKRLMDTHREQLRGEGEIAISIQEERRWLGGLHKELKYHDWEDRFMRRPPKKKYHDWEERVGRPSRKRSPR